MCLDRSECFLEELAGVLPEDYTGQVTLHMHRGLLRRVEYPASYQPRDGRVDLRELRGERIRNIREG